MLLDKLGDYASQDVYPMHMPGHKRNAALLGGALPYRLDVTEIPGFDNLADPCGVLRDMSEHAARLFGSTRAFPLVGGSTCGILAAISGVVPRGGKLIMSRGCHISVYNAAYLGGLDTAYILPRVDALSGISGSVTPEDVDAALIENPDAALIVITSPTYEGVVSDIAAIAAVAHRHGVPLLVDAAHGAHLGFSSDFPESAVRAGADIVVMSLHKTLPALTQCALLHVSGSIVDADALARCVNIFATSSPSYVLLASIDNCLQLIERDGQHLFADYSRRLRRFYDSVRGLQNLRVAGDSGAFFAFDPGKIVVSAAGCGLSGPEMARVMRDKYRVEPEMAGACYVVCMTSVADTDEGFSRLSGAVIGLDDMAKPSDAPPPHRGFTLPKRVCRISDALTQSGELIDIRRAAGMVALEYVRAYPPGIPIIVPGEIVDEDVIARVLELSNAGITVSLQLMCNMVK